MQKRMIQAGLQGMNQDIINPAVNTKQAFEIKNFRINATGHSNGIELTSEKSTKLVPIAVRDVTYQSVDEAINAQDPQRVVYTYTILGQCVLNEYLVLFMHGQHEGSVKDKIVRLQLGNEVFLYEELYSGDLGFDNNHKIECVPYMESVDIQKVYWIDGKNYPRVINIVRTYGDGLIGYGDFDANEDPFSFYQKIVGGNYNTISVQKQYVGGMFYAGVVQYAFNFYNKNAQETPIIYVTPLNYISHSDRGEAPNKQLGCAFKVILNINKEDCDNFDYIRVYSVYRSSVNGTPVVKVVKDFSCKQIAETQSQLQYYSVNFVDTNEGGYDFDAYKILINSDHIKPGAIGYKDQKLFLGNYESDTEIKNCLSYFGTGNTVVWDVVQATPIQVKTNDVTLYNYKSQITKDSDTIKTFKHGEYYKLGFQLQDEYGNWGQVYLYGNSQNDKYPTMYGNYVYLPYAESLPLSQILEEGDFAKYKKIRPVVSFPSIAERSVLCQGVLNPTVFNASSRHDEICYAQSSWFFRPFQGTVSQDENHYTGFVQNQHLRPLYGSDDYKSEIQSMYFDGTYSKQIYYQTDWCDSESEFLVGDDTHGPFGIEDPILEPLEETISLTIHLLNGGTYSTDGISYQTDETNPRYAEYSRTTIKSSNPTVYTYRITVYNIELRDGEYYEIKLPDELYAYFASGDYETTDPRTTAKRPVKNYNDFTEDDYDVYKDYFYVDQKTCTFNSPELQFDSNTYNVDLSQYDARIVGVVQFKNVASKYNIIASSQLFLNNITTEYDGPKWIRSTQLSHGFYDKKHVYFNSSTDDDFMYGKMLSSGLLWMDDLCNLFTYKGYVWTGWNDKDEEKLFMVYPWQRQYLNNWCGNQYQPGDSSENVGDVGITDESESSKIIKKVLSNIRVCDTVYYQNYQDVTSDDIKLFNSDESTLLKLGSDKFYNGNVDALLTCTSKYKGDQFWYQNKDQFVKFNAKYDKNGYPIVVGKCSYYGDPPTGYEAYNDIEWVRQQGAIPLNLEPSMSGIYTKHYPRTPNDNSRDPITMRYKSTPHIVCTMENALTADSNQQYGHLYLAEIYKDTSESPYVIDNDQFSLESRTWVPCGEVMSLDFDGAGQQTLRWTEGDTYFQRYDCLKTYPFSNDDYQSVVEIASFMVETHVNLDGRYDENRGLIDNTFVNPTNFNLINTVYSQQNNFFQYNILNQEDFKTNTFPTRFTWSLNKINGQEIDEWTRTNTAAFYDCDGDKGQISSLRRFNGQIYAFQDKGIARIKYNENVAINTSNGTPIELGNSASVNGIEYLSELVGSQNKWSNISTPNGIFFVDNYTPGIYRLGGGERVLTNLTKNSMRRWFESNNKDHKFINAASFDANVNDVMFTYGSDESTLSYSNDYGVFSGFFDYKGVAGNIKNHTYNIVGDKVYFLREGNDYNKFYPSSGEVKPYWIEFVANANIEGYSTSNALYDNVWYKADVVDSDTGDNMNYGELIQSRDVAGSNWSKTFDEIEVGNDYQYGIYNATSGTQAKNFQFIKKFRTWRVPVPRNQRGYGIPKNLHRDRMRNSWLRVKLKNNNPGTSKMVLRDIYVDSFY